MPRDAVVLLTGYDAKRCARRIHNDLDPTIRVASWEAPATLQKRFDDGRAFEDEIVERLMEALGVERFVDLRGAWGSAATVEALESGVEVVIGAWLPDDTVGGRKGRPDLLIRTAKEAGSWRYVPADVKGHQVTQAAKRGSVVVSTFAAPAATAEATGWTVRTSQRFDDHLQLAHYWRMLEAIGRAPSTPAIGAIIGTDHERFGDEPVMVWLDLEKPLFTTFSRSQGKTKRSALERYDHEHDFRVQVAEVALRQGEANPPTPLVEPVFIDECDTCPWKQHCLQVAGTDVASAVVKAGRLSVREWVALSAQGVRTVDELADLDPTSEPFMSAYLAEVTAVTNPLDRLAEAVRRARMLRDGVVLERITRGDVRVPRADVELDLDIEWDDANRVYLWGIFNASSETYDPVVSWDVLDPDTEHDLALTVVERLRTVVDAAEVAGESVLIYHYSHPEPQHLKRILGEDEPADLLELFVDLLPIVREHWFGVEGLRLKHVAPAFGFHWRGNDPGGLQSQIKLDEARLAAEEPKRDAAREWILEYNEDDVRATAAIRNGDWNRGRA